MLLRVRLLDIALGNLLHHEVTINNNILSQLAASDAPLAGDGEDANRGLSVDEGVDTIRDISEGELVGCLFDWLD